MGRAIHGILSSVAADTVKPNVLLVLAKLIVWFGMLAPITALITKLAGETARRGPVLTKAFTGKLKLVPDPSNGTTSTSVA